MTDSMRCTVPPTMAAPIYFLELILCRRRTADRDSLRGHGDTMTLTAVVNQLGHSVKSTRGVWSWQSDTRVALAPWSSPDKREYHNPNEGARGWPR